jgi:hypothetical protein
MINSRTDNHSYVRAVTVVTIITATVIIVILLYFFFVGLVLVFVLHLQLTIRLLMQHTNNNGVELLRFLLSLQFAKARVLLPKTLFRLLTFYIIF